MKKGQISIEYLIIVGFVVFLVITILGFALFYAFGLRDSIKLNQLSGYADKIISNAESVHFAGEPSKTTVTAYLPEGVEKICKVSDAAGVFLVVDVQTSSGLTKIAFSSDVDFTLPADLGCSGTNQGLTIGTGTKRYAITALSAGGVQIVEG